MYVLHNGFVLSGLQLLDLPFTILKVCESLVEFPVELRIDVLEPDYLGFLGGKRFFDVSTFLGLALELLSDCFQLTVLSSFVSLKL